MTHSILQWGFFALIVIAMLAIDLGVFNKKTHSISMKEAGAWTVVWVLVSLAFAGWVWYSVGADSAGLFMTGYILEKSLSVDNLAVFIMVFAYFGVDSKYHHRVLYWGVLGAIFFRIVILGTGTALIAKFHFLLFGCAIILALGAWKMFTSDDADDEVDPDNLWIVRQFRKFARITDDYHEEKFMVRQADPAKNGEMRWFFTPLAVVLISIEAMDLMFATDSIPTILAVSSDPYIVITSNIFAVLGLRSLYFILAALMPMLCWLNEGIALVLGFIAVKLTLTSFADVIELINKGLDWVSPTIGQLPVLHGPEIPVGVSLTVVGLLLVGSVVLSIVYPKPDTSEAA
ncbi:TerC/Alx family metal homeostasis membrane protein [bacterium]|nr:TerC/Alx family metal homeostasis membrane protein [bacterium]MBP9810431.1 TerC/Alx family metal homeostasis membrane protein [bacterium]